MPLDVTIQIAVGVRSCLHPLFSGRWLSFRGVMTALQSSATHEAVFEKRVATSSSTHVEDERSAVTVTTMPTTESTAIIPAGMTFLLLR